MSERALRAYDEHLALCTREGDVKPPPVGQQPSQLAAIVAAHLHRRAGAEEKVPGWNWVRIHEQRGSRAYQRKQHTVKVTTLTLVDRQEAQSRSIHVGRKVRSDGFELCLVGRDNRELDMAGGWYAWEDQRPADIGSRGDKR